MRQTSRKALEAAMAEAGELVDEHRERCRPEREAGLEEIEDDYSKAPPQEERDADEAYDRWVDEGGTRS